MITLIIKQFSSDLMSKGKLYRLVTSDFLNICCCSRNSDQRHWTCIRWKSTSTMDEEEFNLEKPIKYSTSPAATWKSEKLFLTRASDEEKPPKYQPLIVLTSLVVFMVYFCILREENDVDLKLSRNLYDHLKEIEQRNVEVKKEQEIQNEVKNGNS